MWDFGIGKETIGRMKKHLFGMYFCERENAYQTRVFFFFLISEMKTSPEWWLTGPNIFYLWLEFSKYHQPNAPKEATEVRFVCHFWAFTVCNPNHWCIGLTVDGDVSFNLLNWMNKALFSVPFHLHKLLLYGSPFRLDTTEQETCSVAVPSWLLEILKSLNDLFSGGLWSLDPHK